MARLIIDTWNSVITRQEGNLRKGKGDIRALGLPEPYLEGSPKGLSVLRFKGWSCEIKIIKNEAGNLSNYLLCFGSLFRRIF